DAAGQMLMLSAMVVEPDGTVGPTATAMFTDTPPPPNTVDLTAQASSATVNGAIFAQSSSTQAAGTDVFDSFLAIDNSPTEQGYNTPTTGTPTPLDDKNDASAHTGAL